MPKTRTIKHDFFLDEDLAQKSHSARLLFVGLWLLADRDGRLEDRPLKIKAQIFPYGAEDVDALLAELDGHFIHRFIHNGDNRAYIQIVAFKKHQHIHPDEKSYGFPSFREIPGNPRKSQEIMHNNTSSSTSPSSDTSRRFAPPTLNEVMSYCVERGGAVDPRRWMDYYQARGWKFKGGQMMKDWKAAVRTWERTQEPGRAGAATPKTGSQKYEHLNIRSDQEPKI